MTLSKRFLVLLERDHRRDDLLRDLDAHRGVAVVSVKYPDELKGCQELFKAGGVDAIYCAWHARMHLAAVMMAAQYKAHAFVERPMALASDQCEAMIKACDDNGVILMIGSRLHFQPARVYLSELIQRASITPRGFHSLHYVDWGVTSPNDLLLYPGADCIYAAADILGGFPDRVAAVSRGPGSVTVALTYPHAGLATFTCAYGRGVNYSFANIIGASSTLEVENVYAPYMRMTVTEGTQRRSLREANPVTAEITHFMRCIRKELPPVAEHSGEHGLNVVKTIEAIQAVEATEKLLR